MDQYFAARRALRQKQFHLFLGLSVVLACSSPAVAQNVTPPPPNATEVFAPQVVTPPPGYQPKPGEHGITPLMIAVLNGDSNRVMNLIDAGVNLNAVDNTGTTALIGAVGYGHADIAQRLLQAGADPNVVSKTGDHALGIAVRYKETATAIALIELGANPNSYINQKRREPHNRLLSVAAVTGQAEVVAALVKHGVDLASDGPAALNVSLWKGYEDISAMLILGGVDVNAAIFDPDKNEYTQTGETVLQTAAQGGHVKSVELILSRGALVNASNRGGETALDYALRGGHLPVVRLLIANGASVSAESLLKVLNGRNQAISRELISSLNLATLSLEQFNLLILAADRAGEETIVGILLDGRSLVEPQKRSPRFVFARAGAVNCEVILWDLQQDSEQILLSEKGTCQLRLFVNDEANLLIAVSDRDMQVVPLEGHLVAYRIPLPTKQLEEYTALREAKQGKMVRSGPDGILESISAEVDQVGVSADGEIAIASYYPSIADGTHSRAYVYSGNAWRLADEQYCERADTCPFQQIIGRSLNSRPADQSIWHPNVRRNPYYVSRINRPLSQSDGGTGGGTVVLGIDGQNSEIQYSTVGSGYCAIPCTFTNAITLKLPGRDVMQIATNAGNNSIVERYALVWTQPRGHSKLLDLGTGESVFGNLQVAGWVQ